MSPLLQRVHDGDFSKRQEEGMSKHIMSYVGREETKPVTQLAGDRLLMDLFDANRKSSKYLRIVCLSDTHSQYHFMTPEHGYHLPDGDILVIAGDLSILGEDTAIYSLMHWLDMYASKYKQRIVISGNHDLSFDEHFLTRVEKLYGYKNLDIYRSVVHSQKDVLLGISESGKKLKKTLNLIK